MELLYVGLAPARASSGAHVRSRILGQHLGGNVGSSTFRQSLAALLFKTEHWRTESTGSRVRLVREDNQALTRWQEQNLKLAWVERRAPWEVETAVIALMAPPLNLAGNRDHPLHRQLSELRAALRRGDGGVVDFRGRQPELAPWEPGVHGAGLVMRDGTVATWRREYPDDLGHYEAAEALRLSQAEIAVRLFVDREGGVETASPETPGRLPDLSALLDRHDDRLWLNDGNGWDFTAD